MDYISILIGIIAVAFIFLLIWILKTPIKWAFKLLLNALLGVIILFVVNFLGGFIGVELGINWINALVAGIFGTPGVILLLLLKYVF